MKRDRLFTNGLMRLAAYALMALVGVGVGDAWGGGLHLSSNNKINPDYIRWRESRRQSESQRQKALLRTGSALRTIEEGLGFVPSLVDYSYLKRINVYNSQRLFAPDDIPSSFDYRDEKWNTGVRDQNPYGTCWAHAAIGCVESCVRKSMSAQFTKETSLDLSENNLVLQTGYDGVITDDYGNDTGRRDPYMCGGAFNRAMSYFSRWQGPIMEMDDKYPTLANNYSTVNNNVTQQSVFHVQGSIMLRGKLTPLDHDHIKRAVMNHGALWVCFHYNRRYLASDDTSFYCNEDEGINHAVMLVGWDDGYSKDNFNIQPPGDGAYLIKNSYGANRHDNGYMWVSYYDTKMLSCESYAIVKVEDVDNYSSIYQHDKLGNVYHLPYTVNWGSNVFVATDDSRVAAVGFYAESPNTKYEISIYTDLVDANNPISGTCGLSAKKGVITDAGYTTVSFDQDEKVQIKRGTRFSIVLNLESPGCDSPLATEVNMWWQEKEYSFSDTSGASASQGESFFSVDGTEWWDIQVLDNVPLNYFVNEGGKTVNYHVIYDTKTANLCIKAYTEGSAKKKLRSVEISGPTSMSPGDVANFVCTAFYSDGTTNDVSKSSATKWSLVDGRNAVSMKNGRVEAKTVTESVLVKLKAEYTENGVKEGDEFSFYVVGSVPDAPKDVKASQGENTEDVLITWTPVKGATAYSVSRGRTSDFNNAESLGTVYECKYSNCKDNGKPPTPGVLYYYFIKAGNKGSNGNQYSAPSNGAIGWRKLSAPKVEATQNLSDRIDIKIVDGVEGANAYRIYRTEDIANGEKTPIGEWVTPSTFPAVYQDKHAEIGKSYYYGVLSAVNTDGERCSDFESFARGKRVDIVTVSKIEFSGGSPTIESGESSEYSVMAYYTDNRTPVNVTAKVNNWVELLGGYASVSGKNTDKIKVTANTVTSDQPVKIIAYYRNENNNTLVCTNNITITPGTSPLAAPSGLKVTSQTTAGIGLSWNSVTGAGSYYVYRAANGETAKKIGSANTTSFTDNTATPGVTYTYSVSAANSKGESARSSTVTGTVPLSAPTGVTATSDRTDGVNISWQPSAGATYYRVAWATSKTGTKTELGTWTTNKSYLDTSATAGTTYYYFVRAATSSGGANASGYSDPAAQGMRIPSLGSLSSISIEGQDNVSSGQVALYTCAALYSNGESHTVKADTWSASPTTAATIDGNGKMAAKNVTKDTDVTVLASYTEGGVTKSATKTVKILASTSQAQVKDVTATSRWPFAAILDIDYTLVVNSSGGKAFVRVFGRDADRGVDVAAKTLSGDGSDGSAIAAGTHRLSWDVGTDYPDYHGNAFGVTLSATPYVVPTYTVTYSPGNYGTGTQKTATKTENVALTLLGATFSRTGYTQTGWTTSDGGAKVYDLSASYTANAAITLYPFWTANTYTIKFNANGGTGSMSDLAMTYDVAKNLTNNEFTKSGSDFAGWATSSSGGVMYQNGASVKNLIATQGGTVTLYAKWTAIPTYTVTYKPGANGTGSQQTAIKTKDVALTLKGATFTRTGYTQTGWTTSDGGAKVYDLSASYTANASATLYPFWTRVYNLTPLRNLLTGIEKLNPDGVLSDDELNKAMTNPHYADLDGNVNVISSAEMSIFTRIQALNTDKTLLSNVMKGQYSDIPDATMEELGSISDAIRELTNNR